MYRAFKIKSSTIEKFVFQNYVNCKKIGKNKIENINKKIFDNLDNFKNKKGELNAYKLSNNWFPKINSNVFISHSHNDNEIAYQLAGLLEYKGLSCFLDSCVWGNADKLLKCIDDKFCKNDNSNTYNYTKRNFSTSHVHMMLTTAIINMMYNCECIIFLDTPNSITPSEDIPMYPNDREETLSPWIFIELELLKFLEKKDINTFRKSFSSTRFIEESQDSLNVAYKVDTNELKEISYDIFNGLILNAKVEGINTLNYLYKKMDEEKGYRNGI